MKIFIKAKYIIPALAFFLIALVIILNTNKFFGDEAKTSTPYRTDKDMHFNNNQSSIDEAQKAKDGTEMNFFVLTSPELKNENGKSNDINKTYINYPKNIKLKDLIEKAVQNVEGLPQYVWEPVRFSENDIDEHTAKLEQIVMYSNRVKLNHSNDDQRILSELIHEQIKDKLEYFESLCANMRRMSVARNDDDQKTIDDSFTACNDKIKELEDKLNDYK
jgi:hypothetical protein